jgi:hypothetical protein
LRDDFVRANRRLRKRRRRARERIEHAAAHFGRGFARERDGDDLLGLLHAREQREVTLDQQLGLARAGRGLHDERARDVERRRACRGIVALAHGAVTIAPQSRVAARAAR